MLHLLFRIGPERYALAARHVQEVLPLLQLRPWPGAMAGVAGLCRYRGQALPVLDPGLLVGAAPAAALLSTRILVLRLESELLGLLAEDATEAGTLDPAPFASAGLRGAAWLGPLLQSAGELVQGIEPGALFEIVRRTRAPDAAVPAP